MIELGIGLFLLVLLGLGVMVVGWGVVTYNGLVTLRNEVDSAWAQIDVQLKRRYDLIPNLVEAVKDYIEYEEDVLTSITEARSRAVSAQGPAEQGAAENLVTRALRSLFAVVENYPDLKANTNFLALQEELTSTENKIAFSRQNYNDQVLFFNNKIEMFPSNIIANTFNFTKEEFFEIEDAGERIAPKVQFT